MQEYIALQQAAVKRERAANTPGGGGGMSGIDDGEAEDYSVELTRVGKFLHRRAKLSRAASHKYAKTLADNGFDQIEFLGGLEVGRRDHSPNPPRSARSSPRPSPASGEFSRRRLVTEFGVAQGHAAPILRAIQALPPPAPLEADEGDVSSDDDAAGKGGRAGGGGGGGGGGEASRT